MHILRFVHSILLATIFSSFPTTVLGVVNSEYFALPLKSEAPFTVHNGDVLNVTWFSTLDQTILYLWCGSQQMERITGLSGDGQMTFTVNTTWTSPCHWQHSLQSDESRYFDSGWIDVTNKKATPAVTWQPSAAATACGVQKETGTAVSTLFVTTTAVATTGTALPGDNDDNSLNQTDHATLSTGASMGVGFAIGIAVAGVTAFVWTLLRRRMLKRRGGAMHGPISIVHEGGSRQVYEGGSRPVHELHQSYRLPEADGGWDSRRLVELPPECAVSK